MRREGKGRDGTGREGNERKGKEGKGRDYRVGKRCELIARRKEEC